MKNKSVGRFQPAFFVCPAGPFYGILCQERNGSQGISSGKMKGMNSKNRKQKMNKTEGAVTVGS